VNHGDSCAQGCITPDERERGTPPLLRRIRPSSWRLRGFKPAQRFRARAADTHYDDVFTQQRDPRRLNQGQRRLDEERHLQDDRGPGQIAGRAQGRHALLPQPEARASPEHGRGDAQFQ
jgi:hypothetical protein